MAIAWVQGELFSNASKAEIQQTEFYLSKFKSMQIFMSDFENYQKEMAQVAIDGEAARRIDQEDLHADKTANAVIMIEKQKWVYAQYKTISTMLLRAHSQILDEEVKQVIDIRFLQGYSRKETMLFVKWGVAHSTVDRRIKEGIRTMANVLKTMGFFEVISKEF
ncbi:hypothetical protein [Paenibacillus sp. FSL M8-0142]|uniref:hypothetical protein n=1 Tax=Paenibacillus sp. FSL M8-0142 TaxID=2954525 RepID=UPI00315A008E